MARPEVDYAVAVAAAARIWKEPPQLPHLEEHSKASLQNCCPAEHGCLDWSVAVGRVAFAVELAVGSFPALLAVVVVAGSAALQSIP